MPEEEIKALKESLAKINTTLCVMIERVDQKHLQNREADGDRKTDINNLFKLIGKFPERIKENEVRIKILSVLIMAILLGLLGIWIKSASAKAPHGNKTMAERQVQGDSTSGNTN